MHKYNAHGSTDITGFGLLGNFFYISQGRKINVHDSTDWFLKKQSPCDVCSNFVIWRIFFAGHAQALARNQKNEVSFVIHNLPVIAKMAAVAKVNYQFSKNFNLLK